MTGRGYTLSSPKTGILLDEPRRRSRASSLWPHSTHRQLSFSALVALAYYLGTQVGFLLNPHEIPVATFWPPNAILLAAFLIAPFRMWWIILAAVFPAHLLVQLPFGVPFATAVGLFASNNAEALLGALCIRLFKKQEGLFENLQGVLTFLAFGVVLAPLATSFIDAAVVVSTGYGSGYWKLWTARLFSNMIADLTLAPTIVLFALHGRRVLRKLIRSARVFEAVFLEIALIALCAAIFGWANPTSPALMFTPLPIIVWIVVRFGAYGLYPSLLAMSTIAIWEATRGRHPFLLAPIAESVLAIQIFLCTIAVPMMLLAAVLAERKAAEKALRQSRARLIDAQEQERRRIARELHDDIGQQLTILELELDRLRRRSIELSTTELDKLYVRAAAASAATRTISHQLHSIQLELLHIGTAIKGLCRTMQQETGLQISFAEKDVPAELDPQTSLCLYRIAQGALQNVARHSHAKVVAVALRGDREHTSITIADDGVGFLVNRLPANALGLASMQERVNVLGGCLSVHSSPGDGTTVEAILPRQAGHP